MRSIDFVIFFSFLVALSHCQCPDQDGTLVNWSSLFGAVSDVTILSSQKVKLNTDVQLNSITINGTLVFDDSKNVNLTAHWIKVNPGGVMKIGSQNCPYTHKTYITFTGAYSAANDMGSDPNGGGLGTKGLAVTSGGTLEVFGAVPTITWTRLAAVAQAGSTTLTLGNSVSWAVGNQIAIASTDFSAAGNGLVPDQSEQNEILSISGNTITLKYPLTYMHWADSVGYERAEVGLLTRNIVFQGDASSDTGGFGGHLIFRVANSVHVHGAEFYRMGQMGVIGRYPIHFHLMKNQLNKGFSASYNSIHRSYQRCVTIHDGMGFIVSHNVGFNITGHCYFLEDGPEQLNIFDHNLGMRLNNGSLIKSDVDPAVFWITNPNNTVINNAACGGAFGYWYSLPMHPVGLSETDYASDLWVWPRYTPLGTFNNNVGHSHSRTGLMVDEMLELDETTPINAYTPRMGHYNYSLPEPYQYPDVIATFTNFIGYKNRENGVWTRGGPIHVKDVVLLDNTNGILLVPAPTLVENALIVGETNNIGTEFTYWGMDMMGRSRPVYWTNNYPVTGWSTYDNGGPQFARNITFRNFTTNNFRPAGGVTILPNGPFMLWATNKLEDLKFENANQVYLENWPNAYASTTPENDGPNGVNIIDNDGSVTGEYGNWIVSDTPFMLNDDCEKKEAWNAWVCPKTLEGYTQLRIETPYWPSTPGHYKASFHLLGDSSHPFINVTGGGESVYIYTANVVPFRGYTVRWGAATPSYLEVSLGGSATKEWVIMAIPYPAGTVFDLRTDYDDTQLTSVSSLAELVSRYNYFWDNSNQHLYLFVQSLDETQDELWDFSYHSSYNSFIKVTATCPGSCTVGTPAFGSSPSPALPPAPANNMVHFKATLGGCFASPAIDSDYEGVAFGAYDPATALFTYNIYHTIKSKASRAYLGSGDLKSAGTEYMQLVGSKSSIKGSITISQQKLNDLWAGKFFVAVESTEHPAGELRGFFGCDESSSSQCSVTIDVTDPSSFCSLPTSSLVIYADGDLEPSWDDWSWGAVSILNFQNTGDFVCGTSSMKVYLPGNGQSGGLQFGYYPSTTIDTNTYKYLSFFVKADGSFTEELTLYVQISPQQDVYYDSYRITKDEISSFAIDNTGWAQVLIPVSALGFGSGVQNLRVVSMYTEYWQSAPVTIYLDEIKFLPEYTPTTTDAVTASVHIYNDKQECDGDKVGSANGISFMGILILGLVLLAL